VELVVMHGSDFRVFERDWPKASALMKKTMGERLERPRLRDNQRLRADYEVDGTLAEDMTFGELEVTK
jgi:hypothetical protein